MTGKSLYSRSLRRIDRNKESISSLTHGSTPSATTPAASKSAHRRHTSNDNHNLVIHINHHNHGTGHRGRASQDGHIARHEPYTWPKPVQVECIPEVLDTMTIDFEDYSLGPISNSDGGTIQYNWSGGAQPYFTNDSTDNEEIVTNNSCGGSKAWKLSNVYSSAGQGSPFTPMTQYQAGFSDAVSFNSDIVNRRVRTEIQFTPEASSGDGSTINIYNGSYSGDDRTGLNLYLTNLSGGVSITSYTLKNGSFLLTQIANNLPYGQCHKIVIDVCYNIDPNLDKFIYIVNDGLPQEILSWPNVWRVANSFIPSYGTWLKFASGPSNVSGFIIDNIKIEVFKDCCNAPMVNTIQQSEVFFPIFVQQS